MTNERTSSSRRLIPWISVTPEKRLVVLAIAMVAILAQVIIYFAFPAMWGPDGKLYAAVGLNFLQRRPYSILLAYERPWVYPVLALLTARTFSSGAAWPLLQQVLFALLLIATFYVVRRYFGFLIAALITTLIAVNQPFLSSMRVWSTQGIFGLVIWATFVYFLYTLGSPRSWSVICLGALASLLPMIRPTAQYWFPVFGIAALMARMTRKHVGLLILSFLVPTVLFFAVNQVRYGFFGYANTLGLTAFHRAWDDRSVSPTNGPSSERLFDFMEQRWPGISKMYPEETALYSNFRTMFEDSFNLPEWPHYHHTYYLFMCEVRSAMPYGEAQHLLGEVALESYFSDFRRYLVNTLRYTKRHLGLGQCTSRFFIAPPEPSNPINCCPGPRPWHFEPFCGGYGESEQERKQGEANADAFLHTLLSDQAPFAARWAVSLNDWWRAFLVPRQMVVVGFGLLGTLCYSLRAVRERSVPTVWALAVAAIVFSHPLFIALFAGLYVQHNIPLIPEELFLAVLGFDCLVRFYGTLQRRWS